MERSNKRKHDRKDALYLADYIVLNEEGHHMSRGMGRTQNMSVGGLLLETHRSLEEGQDILITLGLKEEMIELRGRIVHVNPPTKNKRHCSGMKFIVLGEKDKRILRKHVGAPNF